MNEMEQDISCQNHYLKSIHADYIYHKNEKGKTCELDIRLLKKRNPKFFRPLIFTFL